MYYILYKDFWRQKKEFGRGCLNMRSLPCFLFLPCRPANRAGEDCVAELPWEEEVVQHLLPLHLLPLHSSACLKRMTWRECHCSALRSDLSVNKIKTFKLHCLLSSMKLVKHKLVLRQFCRFTCLPTSQDDPTHTGQLLNSGKKKKKPMLKIMFSVSGAKADGLRYWETDRQLEIYYRKVLPKQYLLSKFGSVKLKPCFTNLVTQGLCIGSTDLHIKMSEGYKKQYKKYFVNHPF